MVKPSRPPYGGRELDFDVVEARLDNGRRDYYSQQVMMSQTISIIEILLQLVLLELQPPAAASISTRCSNTSMLRSMVTRSLLISFLLIIAQLWFFEARHGRRPKLTT
ncbi:MAG: hypothetical protein DMF61_23160 [Blastocatellia bacterium AA13]|nr:MAG: hypothetical protein DMF61_23160 [Blastocatellia bacterium AA13]